MSESENKERLYLLQDQLETKCAELEEASLTIEEFKLSLSTQKAVMEKGKIKIYK